MKSYYVVLLILLLGCKNNQKIETNAIENKIEKSEEVKTNESVKPYQEIKQESNPIQSINKIENKTRIMVLPCANGYDYETHGYELDIVLENALKKSMDIEIIPFPIKKMKGILYQGIFDKKDCIPILKKIDVDYIIMNRFIGEFDSQKQQYWGYQTRILNTKSMKQAHSLGAKKIKVYDDLKMHIETNIDILKTDLKAFK